MNPVDLSSHNESFSHLLHFGLSRAIQAQSDDLRAEHPHLRLNLDLVDDENLLPETTCRILFRLYLEAMHNVVRHAEASQVWVRYYPLGQRMMLEIKDDGKGFSIPADWAKFASSGSGVMGMKQPLEAVGGKLHIASEPGQGTKIEASVPIKESEAKPEAEPETKPEAKQEVKPGAEPES
jgi:signal transduction histidine kinase